jgi:Skp family chaperone for outer membrane proteins
MKKVLVVCVAIAASFLFSNSTQAQVKIGVFDEQQLLGFMPGIGKVDTLMQKYAKDSLQSQQEYLYADYQYKDSTLKADSVKGNMSPAVKKVRIDEVLKLRNQIATWNQTAQQMYQAKQTEYLKPYLEKIYDALKEVIAEQKYTVVLKPDAIVVAEKSDELMLRVLAKLKVPLPREVEDQIKALGISTGTGAAKPATTPAKPAVKH